MKKYFTLFLLLAVALGLQAQTAFTARPSAPRELLKVSSCKAPSAAPAALWTDYAAETFAGGDGSLQAPYQIATPEQLALLAKQVNLLDATAGMHYVLTADLDLDGRQWNPIGFISEIAIAPFDGTFDAAGHTVKNLILAQQDLKPCNGLFGCVGQSGTVRNLTVESGNIMCETMAAAVVGWNFGLVENCVNRADVVCSMMYAGGIVGCNDTMDYDANTGVVRNCVNFGNVLAGTGGTGFGAGGIVAANSSLVTACANYGTVEATGAMAGGITSDMERGLIVDCYNRGPVDSPEQTGGLVGTVYGDEGACELLNCYSAAPVTGEAAVGGAVGMVFFSYEGYLKASYLYHDATQCNAEPFGFVDAGWGTCETDHNQALDAAEMCSAEFVNLLALQSNNADLWCADTEAQNDGYPVFDYQQKATSIASTAWSDLNLRAVGNGKLAVSGCAPSTPVEVCDLSGKTCYRGVASHLGHATFACGVHVVRVGRQAFKVAVR